MLKRAYGYALLVAVGAAMLLLLMLDDPEAHQRQLRDFQATQQAAFAHLLFPELRRSAQVVGMEAVDVAAERGLLVMRDEAGLWYAPAIEGVQAEQPPDALDQSALESAAFALTTLWADRWFEVTPAELPRYGLQPPQYRFRFRAQLADDPKELLEATLEIGDPNPENVAYYMYISTAANENLHVYLIRRQTVDMLLSMLTASFSVTPSDESPMGERSGTPVS